MTARIVGDWGTTRLRLFRVADGRVLDRVEGHGIGALDRSPADTLRDALARLQPAAAPGEPVTLCGMAGARGALREAPYLDCPAEIRAWREALVATDVDGHPVRIAPGLACRNALGAPDVMRGEETKLFGLPALRPEMAEGRHLVVMAGTHPKWAELEDGRVRRFQTFFTGEVFAWASAQSTLARAGSGAGEAGDGFDHGLARAADAPGPLGALFEARAAQLRQGRALGWARAYLSGLLIGSEVREAQALLGPVAQATLIAGPALLPLYRAALERSGVAVTTIDGDEAVLAGLTLLTEDA